MISAPRIVIVSVTFFPMGLFYYSSANGTGYTISARNPLDASAMKGLPHEMEKSYAKENRPRHRVFPVSVQLRRAIAKCLGVSRTSVICLLRPN